MDTRGGAAVVVPNGYVEEDGTWERKLMKKDRKSEI